MLSQPTSKRVLVTGASRGIGRAISEALANNGWDVAIHYNKQSGDAASLAGILGDRFSGSYSRDLSDSTNAAKLFEEVDADGPLSAVVNNAGVYIPIDFTGASDETFEKVYLETFKLNFESPLFLSRTAAQKFESRGGGKILNVASRVGFRGESGAALYAASKAALINLTRSMAVELATKKIEVFGIAPGWVETAMAREGMETRLPEILGGIPVGRVASPKDCGAAAKFLLSEEAAYLTGVVIDINGASYFH